MKLKVLVAAGIIALAGCGSDPATITTAEFKQLEEGMSFDEVEIIVGGKPEEIHEIPDSELIDYNYIGEDGVEKDATVSILFNDGKVDVITDLGLLTEDAPEDIAAAEEKSIDTSVFKFAKETEVTDAIDINKHVTVFVAMSEELAPGLAVQHVIKQTYDFLQQTDVEGAETITIAVTQGGQKIAMYIVQKDQFAPDAEKPMTDVVLAASKMEFMTPEVEAFGQSLGTW
ncbi:hypothetical protein [Domibacillus aminovorans]|uniref:Lipoprotein n=1 Tax=Domibacillus aminovorans TaxID=29332 RepID=A0A177LD44_9BACI|nr:hypothetical protein [Domibacillus aminovorans]OAH63257.1 hypothetical protein AWH49_06825 [Domibacillus aminovorans]